MEIPLERGESRPETDIILSIGHNTGLTDVDARRWTQVLGRYRKPSHVRSIAELAITFVPLTVLWTIAWFTFSLGYGWASPLIAIPAAGFLVRLFMISARLWPWHFLRKPWGERLDRPRYRCVHADTL